MAGIIQRSFSGGIIGPSLLGRADTAKYATGAADIRNFIVKRSGGCEFRGGLQRVGAVKTSGGEDASKARLLPFRFNDAQSYVLEVGEAYIRFLQNGARVLTGSVSAWASTTAYVPGDLVTHGGNFYTCLATHTSTLSTEPTDAVSPENFWFLLTASGGSAIAEVPAPYGPNDIVRLQRSQSGDVVTVHSRDYPVHELVRNADGQWTLLPVRYRPVMDSPTAIAVGAATGTGSDHTLRYKVTAIAKDTEEESIGGPHTTTRTDSITATTAADLVNALRVNAVGHGRSDGDEVFLLTVATQTATEANEYAKRFLEGRSFTITRVDADNFDLDGTAGLLTLGPTQTSFKQIDVTWALAYFETVKDVPQRAAPGTNIDITWSAPTITVGADRISKAQEYFVYRSIDKGDYEFIGSTADTSYQDIGDPNAPGVTGAVNEGDPEFTAKTYKHPFVFQNWPGTGGYHQQRQVYGGTDMEPEKVWLSATGDFRDLTRRPFLTDDDPIEFKIAATEANEIRHIVSLGQLVVFTSGSIYTVEGDGGVITPLSFNLIPVSYEGASTLQPLSIDDSALFAEARGSIIRELRYDLGSGGPSGYAGRDLTVFCTNLFDGYTISEWDFAAVPNAVAWAVRSDGALLGLTYLHEHDIWAWHRHDTGAGDVFQSVAVVPENGVDTPYFIVAREVDGSTSYSIERMVQNQAGRAGTDYRVVDRFVDSFLTYDGTNATATTLALTGGSTWAAGETGLTLTASAALFPGDTSNVGNGYRLVGADGAEVECVVTADGSTTVQTVTLLTAAPASTQATATASWVAMVDDVSGLDHLEGRTVVVVGDGLNLGTDTVSSGAIATLSRPYGIIHVGLAITGSIETLDVDLVSGGETVADRKKRPSGASLFVENARGLTAGVSASDQFAVQPDDLDALSEGTDYLTGKVRVRAAGRWNRDGRLVIQQNQPMPATVLAVVTHIEAGGR